MPESIDAAFETYSYNLIAAVLDRLDVPFLLLDVTGKIRAANALAQPILADGRQATKDAAGRLSLASPKAQLALVAFLAKLDGSDPVVDVRLDPAGDGPPLFVALSAFAPPHPVRFKPLRPLAIALIRSRDGGTIDAARSRFGLSVAETQVVKAIIVGQSVGDYAAERGLSVHTARKQLSAAMRKVGVTRQGHLARAMGTVE